MIDLPKSPRITPPIHLRYCSTKWPVEPVVPVELSDVGLGSIDAEHDARR